MRGARLRCAPPPASPPHARANDNRLSNIEQLKLHLTGRVAETDLMDWTNVTFDDIDEDGGVLMD